MSNPSTESPAAEPSRDDAVSAARKRVAVKQGGDSTVAWLSFTIFAIVVLTLIAVIYGLMTGVFGSGAPRTMTERKIQGSLARIEAGSTDRQDWRKYVLGLIDAGQYSQAQKGIDLLRKKLKEDTVYHDGIYLEAESLLAQKKYDEAIKTADIGQKQIKERYKQGEQEYKKSGKPDPAYSTGLVDTYWDLMLVKSEAYQAKKDWKNAIKMYDAFLKANPTAATVFTQRGELKEKIGDKAGAAKDYKQTLVYIPDNAESLAGLKRIGAQ